MYSGVPEGTMRYTGAVGGAKEDRVQSTEKCSKPTEHTQSLLNTLFRVLAADHHLSLTKKHGSAVYVGMVVVVCIP